MPLSLLRLCPRLFGHPSHRVRSWRTVFNKRRKKWTSAYTLQELANLVLAPWDCKLKLDAGAYLVASAGDLLDVPIYEEELSE